MQTIIFASNDSVFRDKAVLEYLNTFGLSFDNNPDVKVLEKAEDKKNIPISEVKQIIKESSFKPVIAKVKAVVIKDAQYLSTEAQNALLKTLEEVPEYIIYILSVNHPDNLLSTIRSRSILNNVGQSNTNDFDIKFSLLSLMKMDLGARIDWTVSNKTKLADRDFVSELFNFWIFELRSLLIEKSCKDRKYISGAISRIIELKRNLLSNNINPFLSVEVFLYSYIK